LLSLNREQLLIGVPSDENSREEDTGGIGNAELAYIHENGSAAANIPARPVLIPGVQKVSEQCANIIAQGAADAIDQGLSALTKAYNKAGLIAQSSVRRTLTQGEGFEPLSDSTLDARDRRGFKGTKPLLVTGQLRNSYTYVVRKRG
jgi:hypothetical protein